MNTEPTPVRLVRDALHQAARSVEVMSRVVRYGVFPILLAATLTVLVGSRGRIDDVMIGLVSGVAPLASLVVAILLNGFAALLRFNAYQAEATARFDQYLSEGLGAISSAMDGLKVAAPAGPTPAESKTSLLADARRAIRDGRWDEAAALVRSFADAHPADDPDSGRLSDEFAEARRGAADDRLARIEAARAANDPVRVIDLRDELKPLVEAEKLHALDRDLAKWLMLSVHRRLRSGTVHVDLAALAGRVAETFAHTSEGASLRASLPTLRRAAGLCPRCVQPYTGIEDACPACLTGVPATPVPTPGPTDPAPNGSG